MITMRDRKKLWLLKEEPEQQKESVIIMGDFNASLRISIKHCEPRIEWQKKLQERNEEIIKFRTADIYVIAMTNPMENNEFQFIEKMWILMIEKKILE